MTGVNFSSNLNTSPEMMRIMPGKRELFSYQGLGSSIRRAFDLTEEVVKSVTYHWRGSPEVSEFGPENGAMYRATVSPIRVLTAGFEPLGPSLVITLEAVWYFHGGPGSFHDAVESFRTGPERVYNETHRYSVRISEPDNIEPGHYMV